MNGVSYFKPWNERKVRVCIISGEFPPNCGGPGYYVYNLSSKLVERGHQITVFTRGSWNSYYHRQHQEGIDIYKVRFIPIYPFHVKLHGFFLSRLLKHLQMDFDIVHLHSPLVPIPPTSMPYIVTQHGTSESDIHQRRALDLHSLLLKVFRPILIAMDRQIARNAALTIAVSESCARELQYLYAIPKEQIKVIPAGVNTEVFTPKRRQIPSEPYVLYTGRLDARKGVEDVITSASYIYKQNPNVKFILVGQGPLENRLRRQIHALNLSANIRLAGFVSRETLIQYYQNASLYVLPSYYEGLPATLLEAMSCALPCVATNVEGNSEVIIDGETGFLVPPHNPERLAEAILKLLNDKQLNREMGEKGRELVMERYDWDVIVNRIEKVYRTVIESSQKSGYQP